MHNDVALVLRLGEHGYVSATCSGPDKLEFMWDATKKAHLFVSSCGPSQRTGEQVNQFRERVTQKIEQLANSMICDGRRDVWFEGADERVANVCADVNGPLAEWLSNTSNFRDPMAIE